MVQNAVDHAVYHADGGVSVLAVCPCWGPGGNPAGHSPQDGHDQFYCCLLLQSWWAEHSDDWIVKVNEEHG